MHDTKHMHKHGKADALIRAEQEQLQGTAATGFAATGTAATGTAARGTAARNSCKEQLQGSD